MGDPDPWCKEADGTYTPPVEPEVTVAQADISEGYDRWSDTERNPQ